ncbi:MAG: hypothetical protein JWN98_2602 [Abditibacteriota bacterium]|nr:hypothetical protein [Abditibacteriota bacterium]
MKKSAQKSVGCAGGRILLCKTRRDVSRSRVSRRVASGFTLVQLLLVLAILSVLAALTIGFFGRGRETSRRALCDMQLKAVALALDAFRQENGQYPANLSQLVDKKYLQALNALRCPNEVRPNGSYAEYYVPRATHDIRDSRDNKGRSVRGLGELAMVMCPLHEHVGAGVQAYKGRYTKQFNTSPAKLTRANGVTVEHPDGKGPIAATSGQTLHGGDRLRVSNGATIEFADGTTCELAAGSDMTVLQSFLEGSGANNAPLYTLVRQTLGKVRYRINHGSKFDVVTPTATAGARGTEFTIDVKANGEEEFLLLTNSPFYISTRNQTVMAEINQPLSLVDGVLSGGINVLGNLLDGLL